MLRGRLYGKASRAGKFAQRNIAPARVVAKRWPVVDFAISTKTCG
jgi:hypothetical protein